MTYCRVVPRDLFNEASLLKCVGRVWILLDNIVGHGAVLDEGDGSPFLIEQDEGSGAIGVANLTFTVRGRQYFLMRPLNSREAWPLYVQSNSDPDFEEVAVFDTMGAFTQEMLAFISPGATR